MRRRTRIIIIGSVILALAVGVAVWVKQRVVQSSSESVSIIRKPAENVTILTNIRYQKTEGDNCYLDIAYQDDGVKKPLLIFVHGGSWMSGEKEEMNSFLYTFSALGYTTATVDYDLLNFTNALQGKCISITDEEDCVAAAAEYLTRHAEDYQIDTDKVVLIGHSAGGQLAGHLAEQIATHPDNYDFDLSGLVLLSAPSDFRYYLYNNVLIQGLNFSLVELSFIFDGVYGTDVIQEINKVDILHNITEKLPPVLILHGSDDTMVPVSLSQNLYDELTAAGVVTELGIIPGAGHGILENETVYSEINRFLNRYILNSKEE